ncbi:Z1 domain-containing protein [Arenibacter sp. 6A1]|uniref:Z1 domain-containing protein n=1 Tax=Arenibacter sp. 6A1 TaxID=2720391 RepID=UPI001445B700|nr:Z1 domain-containing protein [Arenibacter sp. 6A1]NKI26638.1 Z1 domain-containing protein [Arenibacter sp. 6A1]
MDQFQNARNIAHVLLGRYEKSELNSQILEKEIGNVFLMPDFEGVNKEDLIAQLEADLDIYSHKMTELVEKEVRPWLSDLKSTINWQLWDRYKLHIKAKDGSFPIDSLDDRTDKILDKCVNPKTIGSWDRRGMVVGNVQSGKTANYTGLINKATDSGYKLIVVIAGIHNSLRSQTQIRIDEGYIGRNSADFIQRQKNVKIGVGKYASETEIYSYTSSDDKGDFNRSVATRINVPIEGKSPTVLVIKKNKSILENLILWLNQFAHEVDGSRKILNTPLLVIDDEADNASVNSGSELDVRTINRLIRTLLNLFSQNTFIGYTATPYANLYIPASWSEDLETMVKDVKLKVGEDLFPRDFIVNLPPPSNYIGAAQVFGFENENTGESQEALDIIRFVEDQEPWIPKKINKDNNENLPDDIPKTLKEATKAFILTCTIRRLRGQDKKHSSMLVHVALRVLWIDRVAWLINELLRDYKNQIKSGQGTLIEELEDLYENDFVSTTQEVKENISYNDPKIKVHTWEAVKGELKAAVSKIEVRSVHGLKKTSSLEYHNIEEIDYTKYENGFSVIAVGGNKLARGITLEGLSVSYYLRTTRMYDSLMQMGRWFGYRPGYVDLCRLYTTEQLVNWYRHVTMATEEMRNDFDEMAANNKQPIDYQLKVRTHPGMLMITSLTKMREHEKIEVGFSGKLIQTYSFKKRDIEANYMDFKYFISRLNTPELKKNLSNSLSSILWKDVNSSIVLDFLSTYRNDYHRLDIIKSYIEKQNENGILNQWSVAISLNTKANNLLEFEWKTGKEIGGLSKRKLKDQTLELIVGGGKNAILFKEHKLIDLEFKEEPKTENEIKDLRKKSGKPLLIIIPIDPEGFKNEESDAPIIGFGLMFPIIDSEQKYEYAARPIKPEFEESPQESDDPSDDEN